jgi:hypothetical protein
MGGRRILVTEGPEGVGKPRNTFMVDLITGEIVHLYLDGFYSVFFFD